MTAPIFVLDKPATKWDGWGDYADILVHGMTCHQDRKDGYLQLERLGPFVPDVTFPGISDVILTDRAKQQLEAALPGLVFNKVLSLHIVRLDWSAHPPHLEEPPFMPESGEPEDYILAGAHDPELERQLGQFWELVPDIDDAIQASTSSFNGSAYRGQDLVRATQFAGANFISERLWLALQAIAPDCVAATLAREKPANRMQP